MSRFLQLFLSAFMMIVLSACGGGGSNNTSNVIGIAQLGYISGGTVSIYKLSDLNTPIATTQTSISNDLNKAGRFEFKGLDLDSNAYYLLTVTGGEDIDVDDDGIVDDHFTELKGDLHAIVKGSYFDNNTVSINVLSDIAYQKLQASISTMSKVEIENALIKSAQELLYDIDDNGEVNNEDILKFNPLTNSVKVRQSYKDILNIYVPKLHNGLDINSKLNALMYLSSPKIKIENGAMQVVPFQLKANLINVPKGMEVKWYINDEKRNLVDEVINEEGIFIVKAELYKEKKLLKVINTEVIATVQQKIVTKKVESSKDYRIFVTEKSNSSLAGAEVYIPKGALHETTDITIKTSSINTIPHTNGIGVSDIIVMEPEGLHFKKPIQIRIPYNNMDIDESNLRIVRYSKGGEIDYIQPLFIDKETHEIVFETEHFTKFKAETTFPVISMGKYIPFKDTNDEQFIKVLNKLFPNYNNNMSGWEKILNVFIDQNNKKLTIYDLLRTYIENRNMYNIIQGNNKNKEIEALYSLYPNVIDASRNLQVWDEVNKGFKTIEFIDNVKTSIDNIVGGAIYKDLLRNLGVPTSSEELLSISTPKPEDIIKIWDKNLDGVYIRQFFNSRDEIYYNGKFNYTNSSLSLAIDWLKEKNLLWAVESLVRRYETFDPNKEYKIAQDAIESAKTYLKKVIEIKEAKKSPTYKIKQVPKKTYIKAGESVEIPYTLSLYGITNSISLKFDIYGLKGEKLVKLIDRDKVKSYCEIDDNKENVHRECQGVFSLDSGLLDDYKVIKIQAFKDIIGPDQDLKADAYLHIYKTNKVSIDTVAYVSNLNINKDKMYIKIKPKFSNGIDIPYEISVQDCQRYALCSNQYILDNKLIISKYHKNHYNLDDLNIEILPNSSKYYFETKVVSLNINDEYNHLLEESKNEYDENKKPDDKKIEVLTIPDLNLLSSTNISTNEKVIFEFDAANVKKILNKSEGCVVKKRDKSYTLTCSYQNKGSYTPNVKILMNDNSTETIRASKKVYVSTKTNDDKENLDPIADHLSFYTYNGDKLKIEPSYSNVDSNKLIIGIDDKPKHGKVEISDNYFIYTPNSDYTGIDAFYYYVSDGTVNSNVAKVDIEIKERIKSKYIEYKGESQPKDEVFMEKGESFQKTWYFENPIGNKDIYNAKVIVDNSCGFDLGLKTTLNRTIKEDTRFNISYNISIPKDIQDTKCKVSFHLADDYGNILYKNGHISNFWLTVDVINKLPSSLSLIPVDSGIEGDIFTFIAKVSTALTEDYNIKLSLGDNSGGWLKAIEMSSNKSRTEFSKSIKITEAGKRKYRVAIFKNDKQITQWQESTYNVYSKSSIVQNVRVEQRADGALLQWDKLNGVDKYIPMYSLNFSADGSYADMTSGCDFKSKTSCLINSSHFDTHKIWYFSVKSDIGLMSKPVKFEWKDNLIQEPDNDNKYKQYLAGKTLYITDNNNIVEKWVFNDELNEVYIFKNDGSDDNIISISLNNQGLEILTGASDTDYFVIKFIEEHYLVLEKADITPSGVYLSHNEEIRLYFKEPQKNLDPSILVNNTYYKYCTDNNSLWSMTFEPDGTFNYHDGEKSGEGNYTFSEDYYGSIIVVYMDNDRNIYNLKEVGDNYIAFDDKSPNSIYYTSEDSARANPITNCKKEEHNASKNIVKCEENQECTYFEDGTVRTRKWGLYGVGNAWIPEIEFYEEYYANGILRSSVTMEHRTDDEYQLYIYKIVEFNTYGNMYRKEYSTYQRNRNLETKEIYFYSNENLVSYEKYSYYEDESIKSYETIKYDKNGNVISSDIVEYDKDEVYYIVHP